MKNKQGFTIVELLVTVIVLAGFLAMSLSIGRSSMQRAKFTEAFNTFIADFYNARQMASIENKYVVFQFDGQNRHYNIRIQQRHGINLASENSYVMYKTVTPMGGDPFFDIEKGGNFAIGPMGTVRAYPVDVGSDTISVRLKFYKKNDATGAIDFQKKVWIYPSGGIKIEK